MTKKISLLCLFFLCIVSAKAQYDNYRPTVDDDATKTSGTGFGKSFFNHLDISANASTTGIGFDVSSPINDLVRIRMGASFMPHFTAPLKLDIEVGKYQWDSSISEAENNNKAEAYYKQTFLNLSNKLKGFTGITMQDNILEISARPKMNNFKFLVDVFPFRNKKFHLTAGFYYGNSDIASAEPSADAMIPCLAVSMYNNMYKKAVGQEPIITVGETDVCLDLDMATLLQKSYGLMKVCPGRAKHDIVAQQDIYWDFTELNLDESSSEYYYTQPIHEKGDIRYHKGDVICKEGEYYYMTTDETGKITASANTNKFKPYIGGGYETPISKDGRAKFGVNAGVLFWGGFPKVMTRNPLGIDENGNVVYDHIDLTRDLYEISPKIEKYVNFFKAIWIYPNVELKLSYRIF